MSIQHFSIAQIKLQTCTFLRMIWNFFFFFTAGCDYVIWLLCFILHLPLIFMKYSNHTTINHTNTHKQTVVLTYLGDGIKGTSGTEVFISLLWMTGKRIPRCLLLLFSGWKQSSWSKWIKQELKLSLTEQDFVVFTCDHWGGVWIPGTARVMALQWTIGSEWVTPSPAHST